MQLPLLLPRPLLPLLLLLLLSAVSAAGAVVCRCNMQICRSDSQSGAPANRCSQRFEKHNADPQHNCTYPSAARNRTHEERASSSSRIEPALQLLLLCRAVSADAAAAAAVYRCNMHPDVPEAAVAQPM
jgi:hypothetical protein